MKVRNKYVMIVAAVWGPFSALAAAFYLLVVSPQVRCAEQLDIELTRAKYLYSQAQEAAKKDSQTRMDQAVERLRSRVSDFVVHLEAAPDLAFEIAQLANETGVGSFAMRPRNRSGPDAALNGNRIAEKHIDVSFGSPFHRFMALVNALERHHPALFVETFTISRTQAQSSEPQANMELAVLIEKLQGG
jgi:hypothetical protein